MFYLVWKMVDFLINLLLYFYFIIIIVYLEMLDCIRDELVGLEGYGVLDEVIEINGFNLILEDEFVLCEFVYKVVRILISG